MKTLTAKQEARLEKKKKKMAALAEIVKLNDKDRNVRTSCSMSPSSNNGETDENIHNQKVVFINSDLRFDDGNIEPEVKKVKLGSVGDFHHGIDPALSKGTKGVNNTIVRNFGENTICQNASDDAKGRFSLTEEQYIQLKRELNERKRHLRHGPKVRLKQLGEQASLSIGNDKRTPIFLTDIQHLLMVALIGSGSPCYPSRWCHLERGSRLSHSTVLVIEGLSLFHFLSYESLFVESRRIFDQLLEVVMPPNKEGNIIEELAAVPLTSSQKDELIQTYGSLEAAIEISKDPTLMVKTVFHVDNFEQECEEHSKDIPKCDKFPRTQLLLSALQMVDEGYPLPLRGELALRYQNYVFTKDRYCNVTANSPMFGLDCEMCRTTLGCNELTRISIVDENLTPLYETLVRPTNKIIDYLTEYSGITPEMMFNVTKTLKEVQNDVRRILPCDAILVGQSLNADLHAMQMMHPYVIDTSVIFNLTGERKRKAKLQTLAKMFLGEIIQEGIDGHCPVEDSQASLKLTKLKLSKGVEYGDEILKGRKQANEILNQKKEQSTEVTNNLFGHMSKTEKRTALITSEDFTIDLEKLFNNKVRIITDDKSKHTKPEVGIDWYKVETNKAIIRKSQEISRDYSLTIANINVAPQKLEVSRIDKTISNIDKWIGKQWDCVAHNGLFVVLLGGAPGSSSGVAMVKIKKSFSDVVSESSITT